SCRTHAFPSIRSIRGSQVTTHTFELLDKSSDLLKDRLLLRQVLWVQRAHPRQHTVEFCPLIARKLALQRNGDVTLCRFGIQSLGFNELLSFTLLVFSCISKEC